MSSINTIPQSIFNASLGKSESRVDADGHPDVMTMPAPMHLPSILWQLSNQTERQALLGQSGSAHGAAGTELADAQDWKKVIVIIGHLIGVELPPPPWRPGIEQPPPPKKKMRSMTGRP